MSKKSKRRRGKGEGAAGAPAAGPRRARRYGLAALLAGCALFGVAYAATRSNPVRRSLGLAPLLSPAAPQGGQGVLSRAKEYVYAGGRLVATEEPTPGATPTPTPAGPAPTNLDAKATAFSTPAATATITVTWDAPSSGSPASYVVERASAGVDF